MTVFGQGDALNDRLIANGVPGRAYDVYGNGRCGCE